MKRVVLFVFLAAAAHVVGADGAYRAQVKEVDAEIWANGAIRGLETAYYYLYMGSPETEKIDINSWGGAETRLVHRRAGAGLPSALSEWRVYVWLAGAPRPREYSLADPEGWEQVPAPARQALAALGADDPRLLVISCHPDSGSVSIFFHPRYDKDRSFYQGKVEQIRRYLRTRGLPMASSPQEPGSHVARGRSANA